MRDERGFEVHGSRFSELRTQNFELLIAIVMLKDCFSILLCGGRHRCPEERVHESVALKILQILN